jgi:hypothetical protein
MEIVETQRVQSDDTYADEVNFTLGEVRTLYQSLQIARDKIRHDLVTKYDGRENYCVEDDMFLGHMLSKVSALEFKFQDSEWTD